MKKVIFICLLAVSTSLSRPEETQAPAGKPAPNEVPHTADGTTNSTLVVPTATNNTATQNGTAVIVPDKNSTVPNSPATAANDTKADPNAHPTPEKPVTPTNDKTNSSVEPLKPTTDVPQNNSTTDKKNNTTGEITPKPVQPPSPKPDLKPTPKPEEKPEPKANENVVPLQARGFDGASFIGGIILTLSLLAVGFLGFKYYKNQTERNYHTL